MKYGDLNLGQIEAIVNKLGGMEGVKQFLAGNSEVVVKNHIIDCNADPFVPKGWSVDEHKKGGRVKWDPTKITLYLSPNLLCDGVIRGNKLRKELASMNVMNANMLDYLREHPELIPESWKVDEKGRTHYIFFWGTIYRDSGGRLYVGYLCWDDGGWDWDYSWLGSEWIVNCPAAVLAS